ncbi:MAG: hypothetical protein U0414_17495 [Polyangiaceae bacterium]
MIRVSLLALCVAGCGADPGSSASVPTGAPTSSTAVSSGSPLERYFPLVDGHLYSYDVDTLSDHPSTGALSASVSRTGPTTGTFRIGSTTRQIQYEPDGVAATEPSGDRAYLLKAPLVEGTSWLGARGGQIRIVNAHATVAVGAGTFVECVVTEEKRGGDFPKDVTSTYCPDVGLVELSIKSPAAVERASLKQFGPPVNLGPEGVTHTVTPE